MKNIEREAFRHLVAERDQRRPDETRQVWRNRVRQQTKSAIAYATEERRKQARSSK